MYVREYLGHTINYHMNEIIITYLSNPKDEIEKLKLYAKENPSPAVYTLLGTHYMVTEKNDLLAEDYLITSLELGGNAMGIYNLGYLYEDHLPQIQDGQLYSELESKMIKCYVLAMDKKIWQAYNQLGKYFLDNPKTNTTDLSPEQLFTTASEHNIVPACNNLIIMYKNNYNKRVGIMYTKYKITADIQDLTTYILELLNNKDYDRYCKISTDSTRITDIETVIQKSSNTKLGECCICSKEKTCFELNCKHDVCGECLFEIYHHTKPLCPKCQCEL